MILALLYLIAYLLTLLLSLTPSKFFLYLGLLVTYMVSPAGKETIIPMLIGFGETWWFVALVFTGFDIAGSLFMAFNFDLLMALPYAGPWIQDFSSSSRHYLERHPWVGRLYYLAVILYEMLLDGSAGITGSLLGRIMGMTPGETIASIATGSILGCFLFALASDAITAIVPREGLLLISLVAFALLTLLSYAIGYLRQRRGAQS